jgi:hypothetical protein
LDGSPEVNEQVRGVRVVGDYLHPPGGPYEQP